MIGYSLERSVAVAIAQSRGHDPEQMVVLGQPYQIDGKCFAAVSAADVREPEQLWQQYLVEARAAIKAVAVHLAGPFA